MLPHLQRGIIASAAVTALCVANWASPIVIQVVLLLAVFLKVYMSSAFPSDLPYEKFATDTNKGGELPDEDSLQYHLTIEDGKIMTSGRTEGAFVLQGTTVSSHIVGPPSDQCHIGGEFTIFVTLTGKAPINKASVFKVYGSAVFEGEPAMISVQLQMDPQPDGSVDTIASLGPYYATVKRPPGSDQVAYVFQRSSQTLTLTAVTPMTSEVVSATEPCTLKIEPSVSTPMTINSAEESVGALVEFGIYSKALLPDAVNILLVELKRRALLTNPIVSSMAQDQRASEAAMGELVGKNSWGSEKVTLACPMVKDWTRPNFGMVSDECRKSVADHCKLHPKSEGCECWDQDTDAYRRPACVTYRALFDPGSVEQEKLQKPVVQRPVAPPPPFVPEISQTTRRQTWLDFLLG